MAREIPKEQEEDETSPLLSQNHQILAEKSLPESVKPSPDPVKSLPDPVKSYPEWAAEGLPVPLVHGNVLTGVPGVREQWNSSVCACLGKNDEFCSSDLEVCLLGSFAPCVLHGSNAERVGDGRESFTHHCLPYTCLYMLGKFLFGWNGLAPWISYPTRTAIRRRFNLEGTCEALVRTSGCCSDLLEDEVKREQLESACDAVTHFCCHSCALCQEGRELRRRLPHPGFSGRPVFVMIPPMEQTMGRDP